MLRPRQRIVARAEEHCFQLTNEPLVITAAADGDPEVSRQAAEGPHDHTPPHQRFDACEAIAAHVGDDVEIDSLELKLNWRLKHDFNERVGLGVEGYSEIEDLAQPQPHERLIARAKAALARAGMHHDLLFGEPPHRAQLRGSRLR